MARNSSRDETNDHDPRDTSLTLLAARLAVSTYRGLPSVYLE